MVAKNQLPKFVRIQTIYLGAHSNATHTLFHNNQYDLVEKVEQTKLNIPADLLASWKANIDLEVEINKQSMMSALTKELEAKDVDRDRVLSRLFGLIKVHRLSFVEAESKPAERLYAALKPYLGIQKEAFGDETIHIVGLLKDTERFTTEVTALGLAGLLTQLKTLNEDYRKLDAQRRSDSVASKLPNARSVRRQTDADFEVICQCIQASYMLAATKEDKALILTLVNEMNRVASDLKASYKASAAQRKPKDKKKPGGGDGGNGKTPGGDKGSDGKGPNGGKTPDDGKGGKGNNDGKGKGGKKGGDDGNVSPEKALITPLLPALETELNLAHDCLAYGGVTDQQDGVTIYLVVNKRTQEEMYVKVEGGKLVVVEKKG
ncbi:DUF6261 family protein [Hoylesella saccharolytica]|uniref:DUF6261 family protein n=1 Tax=Hoylesella saccharolytica TaxID=633701 RepID=UPI0028D70008|nr:DUF6261 family protein [Hoylesella saccharolytica]